jgi:hypothetical protein
VAKNRIPYTPTDKSILSKNALFKVEIVPYININAPYESGDHTVPKNEEDTN